MSVRKRITRREFFVAGSGIAASTLLVACGAPQQAPAPAQPPAPAAKAAATDVPKPAAATAAPAAAAGAGKYKESPLLADQVKAGKLPPIEQRLPKEPYVVTPGDLTSEQCAKLKIGKYGGTMRLGTGESGRRPAYLHWQQ